MLEGGYVPKQHNTKDIEVLQRMKLFVYHNLHIKQMVNVELQLSWSSSAPRFISLDMTTLEGVSKFK